MQLWHPLACIISRMRQSPSLRVATCWPGRPAGAVRRGLTRLLVGALTLAALAATTGCENPVARKRQQARADSVAWTTRAWAKREQTAPARLGRDFDYIGSGIRRDAELLDRDLHGLQRYIEFDLHRWQERQDDYLRHTGGILRGKPEQIERTAIVLFL